MLGTKSNIKEADLSTMNDSIFFMAVAYGSGQRILLLSDDVDDSGPGYG